MSPPHTEAEHEASVQQAEEATDADQVGEDVSDTHYLIPLLALMADAKRRRSSARRR